MGSNHARVAAASGNAEIAVVVDPDETRARQLADKHHCGWAATLDHVDGIDLAVVASATATHEACAIPLLAAGVPTLVEKPLAQDLASVDRIIKAAASGQSPLMCGFVERFNPIVMTMQRVIEDEPIHFLAVRHSPVVPRIQTSVVHDLLIHDADLAVRFGRSDADAVSSMMWSESANGSIELADAVVHFQSSMIANLSASRVGQRKTREIRLTTPSVLVELDLLRQDITVYRNVRLEQIVGDTITYREQTMIDIPFVRHGGEPLALQFGHFMSLVRDEADVVRERDSLFEPHRIVDLVLRRGDRSAGR